MTARKRPRWQGWAAGAVALATLAGCSGTSIGAGGNSAAPKQESGGTVVVWTDSTRLPGVQAYQKSHPRVKLDIVTYNGDAAGSNYLQTKVELFNRAGKGWPDVVFTENPSDISWAAQQQYGFAAPLDKGLVPDSTLKGFAPGALDMCTVGGATVCLRNDLAQNVLWYNKPLLQQFGYQVPTTWEEYAQLGARVAKEHPGYLIGTAGDSWAADDYFWPSQCPANAVTGGNTVKVDLSDPKCTRVTDLLDPLLANGSISKDTVLSPAFAKDQASKTLMLVGPSWAGLDVFRDALKIPAGQMAAAPPLRWSTEDKPWTGDVGGGLWIVSAHSAHQQQAADLATWMSTSPDFQSTASTYPAYAPDATAWLSKVQASNYFAADITPAFQQAAGLIWPGWSYTRYSADAIWANTVVPAINSGQTLASVRPVWQTAVKNQAQAAGYQVG